MLRIITSLLVAISFVVPIKSQKEQLVLTDTAFASAVVDPCAPLVTVDYAAPAKKSALAKSQKEKHKKKTAVHHHSKHKSKASQHHKSHVHAPHPIPQKISTSHGPLHLTSPPFCG